MTGNTLNEFINDLYFNPEKEIVYRKKRYMISGYMLSEDYKIEVVDIEANSVVFCMKSKERSECVSCFEEAKIFDGRTVYEAAKEIKVLYG